MQGRAHTHTHARARELARFHHDVHVHAWHAHPRLHVCMCTYTRAHAYAHRIGHMLFKSSRGRVLSMANRVTRWILVAGTLLTLQRPSLKARGRRRVHRRRRDRH